MMDPLMGDFWLIDDPALEGTGNSEENSGSNLLGRRVLLNEKKLEDEEVCSTHPILHGQEISCYGWNNTGAIFIQFCLLFLIKWVLSKFALKIERVHREKLSVETLKQ
jgi:hypothetical protein